MLILLIQTNKILKKKLKMVIKRYLIPVTDTRNFFVIQEFSRLTRTKLNGRMTEAWKNLSNKKQVENTLGLGDKNREKMKKFKRLIQITLFVKVTSTMMGY